MAAPEASSASTGVRSSRLGAAAVLTAVTIWAFTNTLIKLSPLPALTFGLDRLWLGCAALAIVVYATGRRITLQHIKSSFAGGLVLGVEISFFFSSIKHTSIADVSVISALEPAIVLLVAGPLFGERVTRRELLWTAVSLAGVVLVVIGSSGTRAWSMYGDVLAAGSLFAWTAYFLVSKHARKTVPTLEYTTVVFFFAGLVVTPLALFAGQPLGNLRAKDLLLLAVFVAGASGGHVLLAWAHSSVDVSVSSLLTLALPVLGSVAGLVILHQPLGPVTIVGGLIVTGALAAIVRHAALVGQEPADIPQT
jgi:drug/metabolite transporter (DMT)-like permease